MTFAMALRSQNSAPQTKVVSGIRAISGVFLFSQLTSLDLYLSARNGIKAGRRKARQICRALLFIFAPLF
jgi:hypothetical protein